MVAALQAAGYKTSVDLEKVEKVAAHFREVRKKYHQLKANTTVWIPMCWSVRCRVA